MFTDRSKEDQQNELNADIYRKPCELILKHIGSYPLDLFKVDIKHLLAIMIEKQISELGPYLKNSIKYPSFL